MVGSPGSGSVAAVLRDGSRPRPPWGPAPTWHCDTGVRNGKSDPDRRPANYAHTNAEPVRPRFVVLGASLRRGSWTGRGLGADRALLITPSSVLQLQTGSTAFR